jgi:hypothetical protein
VDWTVNGRGSPSMMFRSQDGFNDGCLRCKKLSTCKCTKARGGRRSAEDTDVRHWEIGGPWIGSRDLQHYRIGNACTCTRTIQYCRLR